MWVGYSKIRKVRYRNVLKIPFDKYQQIKPTVDYFCYFQ